MWVQAQKMSHPDPAQLIAQINQQQRNNPLSTLILAEPLLSRIDQQRDGKEKRESASSSNDFQQQGSQSNPASLAADLDHYQSLFSKLRFSYLEQVTKEKYLRSIVGDPPVLVSHEDNIALEEKLVGMKSELKAKKEEIKNLVTEMEMLARKVAQRHELVSANVTQAQKLPQQIADLKSQVAEAQARLKQKESEMNLDVSADPRMNLSMQETDDLLAAQQKKMREMDEKIDTLQKDMPGKTRECERAERELEELESKKNEVTKIARELRRIREEGGRDMLEEQGRWYQGSEIILKELLELQA